MRDTLPENRLKFCPVCGGSDFVFDGIKAFSCGNCHFHFFINPAAAVAVVIEDPDGRILLTRRAFEPHKGMLDLPGGFVDPGESVEEAIHREIFEELNIGIERIEFLFSAPNRYVFSNYTVFTADLAFRCVVNDFTDMLTGDDVSEALFFYPSEIDYDMVGSESIKTILKRYTGLYE